MRKVSIAISILLLFNQLNAVALNKPDSLKNYQRIDVSYIFGGQVYNNNLIYNPGFSMQTSYGIMVNESVGLGLGVGYTALHNERFLPVFFEAIGYKKNKPSTPLVKMQFGYSFGGYSGTINMAGYKFSGGIYFDAGIGRKFPVNDKFSILFQCSYRHQFARMEYEAYGTQRYTEAMNFDVLVFSLGLIRHR